MSLISLNKVSKIYGHDENEVKALDEVSFTINNHEFVCILGASGAGKTTLLNILGGMDNLTSGTYYMDNLLVSSLNDKELAKFRREYVGFVFQFYNLMPNLKAIENVTLSLKKLKNHLDPATILKEVGLEKRMKNYPAELSGGEQQRVSIARALVKKPKLLLCDEPTGALDSKTGKHIIALLKDICHNNDGTTIIVTHNSNIALVADRVIKISDGKIIEDYYNQNIKDIDEIVW